MRKKNIKLNLITSIILKTVILIYTFLFYKIVLNRFGSSVNGLVNSITTFLLYITILESGVGPVVKSILYKPISEDNNKEVSGILKSTEVFFRKIALIFIPYSLIISVVYPLIVNKEFDFLYTFLLVIIIAISKFIEYYFGITYRLYLQARQKSYIVTIIQIVLYVINCFVLIVLYKLKASIHVIEFITGLVFILMPLIQNIYVKKKYNINTKIKGRYEIKNKWDGLIQHIAYVIHSNTDIIIITVFTNLKEVSVYSVYYLVIKGIKAIISCFTNGIDSIFGDIVARNDDIKEKFNIYETSFYMLVTILFATSIVLINPFVSLYTKNLTDVNYVRVIFGYLIVISEFIWAVRQPYNDLIRALGHFKQTKRGALIECFSNLIISLLLVHKFGLIGVAIGTIVAMTLRTIELVYYSDKNVLHISVFNTIKKILLIFVETIIIFELFKIMPLFNFNNYIHFIANGFIVTIMSLIVVLIMNYIFYRKDFKSLLETIIHFGKI